MIEVLDGGSGEAYDLLGSPDYSLQGFGVTDIADIAVETLRFPEKVQSLLGPFDGLGGVH